MNKKLSKILVITLICLLLVCVSLIVFGCENIGLSKQPMATIYFYMQGDRVSYQFVSLNQVLKAPDVSIPDGYQLDGWFFDENTWTNEFTKTSLTALIDSGETQANVYAKLSPIDYGINYANVKDADVSALPTQYTVESETITLPDISVEYYLFNGWYDGQQKVEQIAKGSFGNKTLTARFTPIDYVITYNDTRNATNGNPAKYNIESGKIDLVALSKDGYKFEGWYNKNELVTSIPANSHGNVELTAKWSLVTYTIAYEQAMTADTSEFPNTFTIESDSISIPDISVEYYTFEGWYDGQQKVEQIATGSFGNKALKAKLTPINYTITYNGTRNAANGNPAKYNIESGEITLAPITANGYSFDGWYKDGTLVTSIPASSHGSIELTAKWSLVTFSITYDQTFTVDTSAFPASYTIESDNIALPTELTVICRIFRGWTLNGRAVSEIPTGTYGNLVLTATYQLDHDVAVDAYVAPTCEATGLSEGSHCNRCSEVIVAQNTIPALGHDYAQSWEWNGYNSATVSLVCKHNSAHELTLDAIVSKATVPSTCAKEGLDTYTANVNHNGTAYSDVKTQVVETVPHNYVAIADNKEKHTCSMCNQLFDHVDTNYYGRCEVCDIEIEEIIEITSNYGLLEIAYDLSASYVLRNDITLSGNWSALGSTSQPFTGKFYGNGFAIVNLSIRQTTGDGGLFVSNKGLIDGLTLKNLTVTMDAASNASGSMTAAGIAAFNYGTIRNCKIEEATFKAYNNQTNNSKTVEFKGGLICGFNYKDGKIENCEVNGTVIGDLYTRARASAGGIASESCSVVSKIYYGDLVGVNEGLLDKSVTAADCKLTIRVEGSSNKPACEAKATMNCYAGSLVGENRATVSSCKAKPYVISNKNVGTSVDSAAPGAYITNTASLNLPEAPQYEKMVGVNTANGIIIRFEKIEEEPEEE